MRSRPVANDEPELSQASRDPWASLAVGVVLQAVRDMRSPDLRDQFSALLWWVSDDAGDLLSLAGLDVDRLGWLVGGVPRKRRYRRKEVSNG